jgi:hypothetical protein
LAALRAGFFLAGDLVDTFRDAELFEAAAVLAGLRAAGFLAAVFRAAGFLAAALRAAGFLAAGFLAAGFFAAGLRAAGFLAAGFFAATLFAAGFLAAGFFAATFLAAGFLAAAALLGVVFLAAGLAAALLVAGFFADAFVLFAFITLVPLPELSTLETCGSALVVHTERETNSEALYDHDAKNRAWIFTLLSKPLFLKRNFPVEAIEEFDRYREGSSCEGDVQWTSISPAHS